MALAMIPDTSTEATPTGSAPTRAPSALLALFAPYNEVVELIASWTDWQPKPMTRGDDGWWRYESTLPDGEYHYKFRVKSRSFFCKDEMVEIFDPYALSITNDDRKAGILVVKDGVRQWVDYQWKHDAHPLPSNGQLVIYEMHIGDFPGKKNGQGTFADAVDRLDHLSNLGINCIELMPVKQFSGYSWGYLLESLFGVENRYGKPEDLCRLIDECHARGIRVIVDGVYNHADKESPLTRIDYELWFYRENPDPPEWHWGPKFDYSKHDEKFRVWPARKYVTDSIRFWVEKFHIDGLRFDATRALGDFQIIRLLADAAYDKINGQKNFMTIAEHVPEDPAITGRARGAPVDAAWHDSIGHRMQALISLTEQEGNQPLDLDGLVKEMNPAANGYEHASRLINFITNHDQKRAMQLIAEDGKMFDDAAFRRMMLGSSLLFTMPGIPLIWMGQEFGFASDKSLDPRPIDWDLLKNDRNRNLLEHYKGLIHLRRDTPALQSEGFEPLIKDESRKVLAFKRWNKEGNVVLVVANLHDEPAGEVTIEGPCVEDGHWHEFFGNYDVHVQGGKLVDTYGPSQVKIFVRKGA